MLDPKDAWGRALLAMTAVSSKTDVHITPEETAKLLEIAQWRVDEADEQVADSERIVAFWTERIAQMEAAGQDASQARELLTTYAAVLKEHRANRPAMEKAREILAK
jgi:hypothetical protein